MDEKNPLDSLNTPDDASDGEDTGKPDVIKPRRGRPPGIPNKPKLSDETLLAGCIGLVRMAWLISSFFAKIAGGKLENLTDKDELEGAKEARALVLRFGWLVTFLTIVGFPLWLVRTVIAKFKMAVKPKEDAKLLKIVPPEKTEKSDTNGAP